jgi:hypothetical protein
MRIVRRRGIVWAVGVAGALGVAAAACASVLGLDDVRYEARDAAGDATSGDATVDVTTDAFGGDATDAAALDGACPAPERAARFRILKVGPDGGCEPWDAGPQLQGPTPTTSTGGRLSTGPADGGGCYFAAHAEGTSPQNATAHLRWEIPYADLVSVSFDYWGSDDSTVPQGQTPRAAALSGPGWFATVDRRDNYQLVLKLQAATVPERVSLPPSAWARIHFAVFPLDAGVVQASLRGPTKEVVVIPDAAVPFDAGTATIEIGLAGPIAGATAFEERYDNVDICVR